MEVPPLALMEPYASYLKSGKFERYASSICDDGLKWWFNMDIPCLAAHLMPLASLPKTEKPLPGRLLFLSLAVRPDSTIETFDGLYNSFTADNDLDAAAAVADAAIASIWHAGSGFDRFGDWNRKIDDLLGQGDGLSPLACASLLISKSIVEQYGQGDLQKAFEACESAISWAEKARSSSLRVYISAHHAFCCVFAGRFTQAGILLSDAEPLYGLPETAFMSKMYYKFVVALIHILRGDGIKGEAAVKDIVEDPAFDMLPSLLWLAMKGLLLLAASHKGNMDEADRLSEEIKSRTVHDDNHYIHGRIHYDMGIAFNMTGRSYKAFVYSREAIKRGKKSGSTVPEIMTTLLLCQALSDMNERDDAMDILQAWIPRWKELGYDLLAASGTYEIARLLLETGRIDEARDHYAKAVALLKHEQQDFILHRPPSFLLKLKDSLFPAAGHEHISVKDEPKPVSIEVFGSLCVRIRDTIIYDRKWRGGRTKTILKALIVNGGEKVSCETLADILWPDADGDMAARNLKVAVSRLRRIGCRDNEKPLPWIVVSNGQYSIASSLCSVDSLLFSHHLSMAVEKKDDADLFIRALDLYRDDFLVNDRSEIWIIQHREVLREEFVTGALRFADLCAKSKEGRKSRPYLKKALQHEPLREELYERLMKCYLRQGYASQAIKVYKKAEEVLQSELQIPPGPALRALEQQARGTSKQ